MLVDETGGATTADGSKVTPEVLATIAAAVQTQVNRDLSPEIGGGPVLVRVAKDATDVQPGEVPFFIRAALLTQGAVADHQDVAGAPYCEDAITASDTLTGPGNSLSVAVSHEICEAEGDPGCNRWADRGDGAEVAVEECDAVEAQSYDVGACDSPPRTTGVYVSNFVLKSFWQPGASGPYDFMTSRGLQSSSAGPAGPMQTAISTDGANYQIMRTSTGTPQQVTGANGAPRMVMGPPTVSLTIAVPFGISAAIRRAWRHGSRRHRRGVKFGP